MPGGREGHRGHGGGGWQLQDPGSGLGSRRPGGNPEVEGPVHAPTDDAFAKLPKGTVEDLLKPQNKAKLVKILTYHVVAGKVLAADVVKLSSAKTVEGSEVKITVTGGKVKVDDANVVKTDIATSNGVIHMIDSVLLPK